jgi:hypothetical protein
VGQIGKSQKGVETSLDAADTSVRATSQKPAKIWAGGGGLVSSPFERKWFSIWSLADNLHLVFRMLQENRGS